MATFIDVTHNNVTFDFMATFLVMADVSFANDRCRIFVLK